MWTVTLEVQGDEVRSPAAHDALEQLLTGFGICHVTVGHRDGRYIARFCVGGHDERDAERNAMAMWRYAIDRIGLIDQGLARFDATAADRSAHLLTLVD